MINSSLCYIKRGGDYLLLNRAYRYKNRGRGGKDDGHPEIDPNYGKWIGFGGKFKEGESPEDCVLREVFEETGLTLTSYRYRGIVTFVSDVCETEYMHLFDADGFTGELRRTDEGITAWIGSDVFRTLPQWEGDRIFLDLISRDVPFFSLKLRYAGERLEEAVLNGDKLDF